MPSAHADDYSYLYMPKVTYSEWAYFCVLTCLWITPKDEVQTSFFCTRVFIKFTAELWTVNFYKKTLTNWPCHLLLDMHTINKKEDSIKVTDYIQGYQMIGNWLTVLSLLMFSCPAISDGVDASVLCKMQIRTSWKPLLSILRKKIYFSMLHISEI